jgi:phosphoribosyl-ATP pyrophosphohydrolase
MTDTGILGEIWDVIDDRVTCPQTGSYVSRLINDEKGIDRVLEKVGEEATEFIIAVKNGSLDRTVSEAADLLFHLMIALRAASIDIDQVMEELASRRK